MHVFESTEVDFKNKFCQNNLTVFDTIRKSDKMTENPVGNISLKRKKYLNYVKI